MLFSILLTGCTSAAESFINEVNSNVNVLGVKLNMKEEQVKTLNGSDVSKDPCILGYEFNYVDKLINVGFKNEDNTVRRITTKNPETSVYGIKPGASLDEAFKKVTEAGFTKDSSSKYKFHKNNILLTILSMEETLADGITIEFDSEQN